MAFLKTWPSLNLQQVCWYVGWTGGRARADDQSISLCVYLLTTSLARDGLTAIIAGGQPVGGGKRRLWAAKKGQERIAPVPPTTSNFFPLSLSRAR